MVPCHGSSKARAAAMLRSPAAQAIPRLKLLTFDLEQLGARLGGGGGGSGGALAEEWRG